MALSQTITEQGDVTLFASVLEKYFSPPASTPPPPLGIPDSVVISGLAFPRAGVHVLYNGSIIREVRAMPDGTFEISIGGIQAGVHTFGVQADDEAGRKSKLLNFTVTISSGVTTEIRGVFIPPTLTSDKADVRYGDPIVFFGTTIPSSEVRLSFTNAKYEWVKKVKATGSGMWTYTASTSPFGYGDMSVQVKAVTLDGSSPYGDPLTFHVGTSNRLRTQSKSLSGFRKRCDLNDDGRVNLLDFSIMAFWYKRYSFPPKVDLNTDQVVNLTDLSILAYCWTG